jgi:metal-responsive CopG/Arc/MetJ family transcriptional regulator
MKPTAYSLDEELIQDIEKRAYKEHTTRSALVRRLLRQALDQEARS